MENEASLVLWHYFSTVKRSTIIVVASLILLLTSVVAVQAMELFDFIEWLKQFWPTPGWNKYSFGETLTISSLGQIYLNGQPKIAIGFHLKHEIPNPSLQIAEQMLQRLQNDGIRFMVLNFVHWEHSTSIVADIDFWMPLLAKYHMWTFIQLQADYDDPSSGGSYADILNPSIQLPRQQFVIQTLSANPTWANMIYAWSIGWELDAGVFGFDDADVTAYLQNVTPIIKGYLSDSAIGSIPILNKPQGHWSDNRGRIPMGLYGDLLGSDYYASVTVSGSGAYAAAVATQENILHTTYMTETNKIGYAIWRTEWGIQNGLLNDELTPSLFNQALDEYGYHDCGSLMMWIMWTSASNQFAAFNPDGTAKQWYINISGIF